MALHAATIGGAVVALLLPSLVAIKVRHGAEAARLAKELLQPIPSECHPRPALKVQKRFLYPCVGYLGAPEDSRAWPAFVRVGSLTLPSRRLDPPGDAADVNIAARARDAADNVGGTREDGVHGLMLTLQLHSVRPAAVEHEGLVRVGYTGRRHPRLAVRCGDRARSLRQRLRHQGAQRGQGGQSGEWRDVLSEARDRV